MALSHVQDASTGAGSGTTITATFPATSTTGNLICVAVLRNSSGNPTASVSDSKGNTYVSAVGPTGGVNEIGAVELFYAKNITGGGAAITVTVTFSNSNSETYVVISEFSGANTTAPLDKTASKDSAASVNMDSTATAATTQADELLFGGAGQETVAVTISPQTGWTSAGNPAGQFFAQWRIVAATAAYSSIPVQSSSSTYVSAIATFKATAGGGGGELIPGTRTLLTGAGL